MDLVVEYLEIQLALASENIVKCPIDQLQKLQGECACLNALIQVIMTERADIQPKTPVANVKEPSDYDGIELH